MKKAFLSSVLISFCLFSYSQKDTLWLRSNYSTKKGDADRYLVTKKDDNDSLVREGRYVSGRIYFTGYGKKENGKLVSGIQHTWAENGELQKKVILGNNESREFDGKGNLLALFLEDKYESYYPGGKPALRLSFIDFKDFYNLENIIIRHFKLSKPVLKGKPVIELFYDNGKRALLFDLQAGKYQTFFDTGNMAAEMQSTKSGYQVKQYYRNGHLAEIINYDPNLRKDGEYIQYYLNGSPAIKGQYLFDYTDNLSFYKSDFDDQLFKAGVWQRFYLNGKIAVEENYAITLKYDTAFADEMKIAADSDDPSPSTERKQEKDKEPGYTLISEVAHEKKIKVYDQNSRLLAGLAERAKEEMIDSVYSIGFMRLLYDSIVTRDIRENLLDEAILDHPNYVYSEGERRYADATNKPLNGYIIKQTEHNLRIDRLSDGILEERFRAFQIDDDMVFTSFGPSHPALLRLWPDCMQQGELKKVFENARVTQFDYKDKTKINIIPNIINYIRSFERTRYGYGDFGYFKPTIIIHDNDRNMNRLLEEWKEITY